MNRFNQISINYGTCNPYHIISVVCGSRLWLKIIVNAKKGEVYFAIFVMD